ncbi:MAG: DUF1638 domain-containing protein [Alphaproteobacteria bacterium]
MLHPDQGLDQQQRAQQPDKPPKHCLLIACGALAVELIQLSKQLQLEHQLDITCLPAKFHNYPDQIIPNLARKIADNKDQYQRFLIGYGDCGTGGMLDRFIKDQQAAGLDIARIEGAHCYQFYAGADEFDKLTEAELGSFYLTDYLVKFFDRLIIEGMGLDRYPQLKSQLFAHYKKLVYLAQSDDPQLDQMAQQAAIKLELEYQRVYTGIDRLAPFLNNGTPR